MRPLSKLNLLLLRSPGFIAAALIGSVLAVQWAGAWYWLEITRISKEDELHRHLLDLGNAARSVVEPRVPDLRNAAEAALAQSSAAGALPGADPGAVEAYQADSAAAGREAFDQLAKRTRLRDMTLMTPGGLVLYSLREPARVLEPYPYWELDRDAVEAAAKGEAGGPLVYAAGAAPLKRAYVPVRDGEDGPVAAVLALTGGRDYLFELERLEASARGLLAAASILVLMIGWFVYRMIARQRAFERTAAHADRLTSLGTLAAGFAHEIRNPLEIIGACAEDLQKSLEAGGAGPEARETCEDIVEEVERMNGLVGQFLQYSKADHPAEPCPEGAPVAAALQGSMAMLRHAAEKRGVALSEPAGLDPSVRAAIPEARLRQIIVNLVMNAIQATPPGGRAGAEMETDGRRVRLRFTDTGPGIPREIRSRVFDPFFTTRAEGSGLGLAIAHRFAASAGGSLECLDPPGGRGALLQLTLPPAGSRTDEGPGDS